MCEPREKEDILAAENVSFFQLASPDALPRITRLVEFCQAVNCSSIKLTTSKLCYLEF